jgi:hypothetical protein
MLRPIVLASALALGGCESFESRPCGDLYVHSFYGGLGGQHRYVVINESRSLRYSGADDYWRYVGGSEPKVAFNNENPLVVSCGPVVSVASSAPPEAHSLPDRVEVKIVEPYELSDEAPPDGFVIR